MAKYDVKHNVDAPYEVKTKMMKNGPPDRKGVYTEMVKSR